MTAIKLKSVGNTSHLDLGEVEIWFSYETPIAFRLAGGPPIVSENVWGTATGKHLNLIDGGDKRARLPRDEFVETLAKVQRGLNYVFVTGLAPLETP
jgi:hypothetical protein